MGIAGFVKNWLFVSNAYDTKVTSKSGIKRLCAMTYRLDKFSNDMLTLKNILKVISSATRLKHGLLN